MINKYIVELVDGNKVKIGNNRDDFGAMLNGLMVKLQNYPNMFVSLKDEMMTDENFFIKGSSVVAIYKDNEREIINE